MKPKKRRVFLWILVALLIGIAVFAYTQRGNLKALYLSLRCSEEYLAALQEQQLQELIEDLGLDPEALAPSTPDASGPNDPGAPSDSGDPAGAAGPSEASASEGSSVGASDNAKSTSSLSPEAIASLVPSPGKPAKEPAATGANDKLPSDVVKITNSFYSLQSQYLGKIEGIKASAMAKFDALPKAEQTDAKRISIVRAGISQLYSLESQCDSRVASLVSELRAALRKNGMDESLARRVEYYYATQKGLIKAEYMRKYTKYLK